MPPQTASKALAAARAALLWGALIALLLAPAAAVDRTIDIGEVTPVFSSPSDWLFNRRSARPSIQLRGEDNNSCPIPQGTLQQFNNATRTVLDGIVTSNTNGSAEVCHLDADCFRKWNDYRDCNNHDACTFIPDALRRCFPVGQHATWCASFAESAWAQGMIS